MSDKKQESDLDIWDLVLAAGGAGVGGAVGRRLGRRGAKRAIVRDDMERAAASKKEWNRRYPNDLGPMTKEDRKFFIDSSGHMGVLAGGSTGGALGLVGSMAARDKAKRRK